MRDSHLKKLALSGISLLLLLSFSAAHAEDDTTLVPMDQIEAPATDLTYQGRPIDQDEAVSLAGQGVDLSQLDPVPNDMWGLPANFQPMPMPEEGATLNYDSSLAGFGHEISIHRVTRGALAYRLDLSTVPHRALLTRALLARLGYNQYAPKRYPTLKIRFRTVYQRQAFLDAVALDTVKDPATWIKEMPEDRPELTLQDVVLEPGRIQIQNYYWAVLPSNFSEGRRALRALLVPISLCNAPENIDSYRWDFGRILNNSILVPYPKEIEDQRPFDTTSIDDMRWIARRIARLSLEDWRAIVAEAGYPAEIGEIVLQKIVARRNQMLSSLSIDVTGASALPYDVHFSNTAVKDGQVIQAHFEGYASRFTYGDAEDPMSPSEMQNLGIMQVIASAMGTLSSQISQKMVVAAANDYLQAHIQQVAQDFFKHLIEHPNEPYSQPISTWGGPVGGFNLTASRQVSTGTFYGSNAPIQLVDTVGFSGSLGYFRGIDGVRNVIPGIQANVTLSRNYTHLRSMPSIKDTMKVPAKDFVIPSLLSDLSKILSKPKSQATSSDQPVAVEDKAQDLADYTQAVEDLLSKIRDGEMFTITDTLSGGAAANAQIPAQILFPGAPVGYNQNLTLGAQGQGVVLRRTTLRRIHDELGDDNYLQIYVQSMDSVTGNLMLDFNYWINVAHFGMGQSKGQARTRVYTIKSDPERAQETSKTVANSLRGLLRLNNDSSLKSSYPFYLLRHDLSEDDWKFRFLVFQNQSLSEKHRLRIQPPTDADHPFDPRAFERTFYAYRELKLSGVNYLSFMSNIVDGASKGKVEFNAGGSENPAYSPFGRSHWTELYSDVELSADRDYLPLTIARETWAGWAISQKKLYQIFDALDAKLGELRAAGANVSPIHRDIFAATEKLEFYNVTANTIFYSKGLERIFSALSPGADPAWQAGGAYSRWSKDAFSSSDQQAVSNLVSWLGGESAYAELCAETNDPSGDQSALALGPFYFKGNRYSCLEQWMMSILKLRRKRPPSDQREATLEWQTHMLSLLQEKIPLSQLMKVAQKDGFYFQVRVNGFRKGDHEARDSEKREIIASYVSDSVGTADQFAGAGAFNWLADKTRIMPYEVNALYFSGGN